ncbi:hydrogen peroxide-inducible genes activator [Marinifilum caeruleilacunae]|uniref:Hydrogen peroxide-inducible genes activator n=1 Tax=Marinifilum caeruleilacunae TaxID=2499076 RepID=A0ABX1WW51_9BACT|nr:hydrogen peroxide-inducible genes activator [Marinifilum caeruleilacunae]NOU60124.1 hydrogen peroxide-inducible genes activator [Marinifilum caeruleilacunae]
MTLKQLEYALALGNLGSYGRVAKFMGVSQPAVSLQIQALEEELGIKLFDRSKKKVETTSNGELFLEKAQLLVTQSKHLEDFALELSEEVQGDLNLGIIPTLSPYLVPLFADELKKRFPKIKLVVKELITEEVLQGVKEGELHGGIISTPIQIKSKLELKPIFYEKFYLYVSEKHALFEQDEVEIEKINTENVWMLKEGNCFMDQVANMCSIAGKHESELIYESNNIDALRRIVEYKGGLTFVPELATLMIPADQEDLLKELSGIEKVREISLVQLKSEVRKNLLTSVVETIQSCIPKQMLNKEGKEVVKTNFIEG